MQTHRAVVTLRHNTYLAGDVKLALRELEALVGEPGVPLRNRRELVAAIGRGRLAHVPELATEAEVVGVLWNHAPNDGLQRLLRRSAFAQELIVLPTDTASHDRFLDLNRLTSIESNELAGKAIVSVAYGYLIESEGVLDDPRRDGRLLHTANLLLEPYLTTRPSQDSSNLRKAKKTTLSLSHDLHIYKAKFFPRMVRALLNIFASDAKFVFDPFCGSGTALLEAALLGIDSSGVDFDPICQLISRSKITPFLQKSLLGELDAFDRKLKGTRSPAWQKFPAELEAKIARRDRIDGTNFLPEIKNDAATLAAAFKAVPRHTANRDLMAVLASDAVTKKIRYRFIGVGNGKYTIEILRRPLLDRVHEKIERCRQLTSVFRELREVFGLVLGQTNATAGDAYGDESWTTRRPDLIVTSPPYLPASSGREHYASSRALAFAVLGLSSDDDILVDREVADESILGAPTAKSLIDYLASDASDTADPQRDAMRFMRKLAPTKQYLVDQQTFLRNVRNTLGPAGTLLMVVAHHHTFYSHRRQEIEHVVAGASLYGELAVQQRLTLKEEISMELLKGATSRARPRAKDDYFESVLVFQPDAVQAPMIAAE